jgi:hypothetical protein
MAGVFLFRPAQCRQFRFVSAPRREHLCVDLSAASFFRRAHAL